VPPTSASVTGKCAPHLGQSTLTGVSLMGVRRAPADARRVVLHVVLFGQRAPDWVPALCRTSSGEHLVASHRLARGLTARISHASSGCGRPSGPPSHIGVARLGVGWKPWAQTTVPHLVVQSGLGFVRRLVRRGPSRRPSKRRQAGDAGQSALHRALCIRF
jgi:hypothetical protein